MFYSMARMLTFLHEFLFFQKNYINLYEIAWTSTMVKWISFIVKVTRPKLGIYIYTNVNEKFYIYTMQISFKFSFTLTQRICSKPYTHTQH